MSLAVARIIIILGTRSACSAPFCNSSWKSPISSPSWAKKAAFSNVLLVDRAVHGRLAALLTGLKASKDSQGKEAWPFVLPVKPCLYLIDRGSHIDLL